MIGRSQLTSIRNLPCSSETLMRELAEFEICCRSIVCLGIVGSNITHCKVYKGVNKDCALSYFSFLPSCILRSTLLVEFEIRVTQSSRMNGYVRESIDLICDSFSYFGSFSRS